jgi:hypothetical protein
MVDTNSFNRLDTTMESIARNVKLKARSIASERSSFMRILYLMPTQKLSYLSWLPRRLSSSIVRLPGISSAASRCPLRKRAALSRKYFCETTINLKAMAAPFHDAYPSHQWSNPFYSRTTKGGPFPSNGRKLISRTQCSFVTTTRSLSW